MSPFTYSAESPAPTRRPRPAGTSPRVPTQYDGCADPGRADYDSVVVGLGKVGLATAIALAFAGRRVHAIAAHAQRVREILGDPDELCPIQRAQLRKVLARGRLTLSVDTRAIGRARSVVMCEGSARDQGTDEETGLRHLCAAVVSAARRGQVLVLTTTPFVGATEELLIAPLRRRGLVAGDDVHVCFSPDHVAHRSTPQIPELTPRVIGGATPACVRAGSEAIAGTCAGTEEADCLAAVEITEMVQRGLPSTTEDHRRPVAEQPLVGSDPDAGVLHLATVGLPA